MIEKPEPDVSREEPPKELFTDASRLPSPEITRAFASAIRAVAQGPQCELSARADVSLDISDVAIVRGVD